MGGVVCNYCRTMSSVTSSTQHVRCHGCHRLLSVGNPNDGEWTTGQDPQKKNLCQGFKKMFASNHPQTAPPIAITDLAPRGKRALICGVSYKKHKYELKGTAHDVKNMRKLLLEEFNFSTDSILLLSEEEPHIPPTRKNIEDAFKWLVRGIQPGDSLVFYFSGHGKRQPDLNGDEIDGFDETICPMDFENEGMILDNDINDAIVRPLIEGVVLHAIVDSCHSGTILDLPHVFNITSGKWDDNYPPSGTYKGTNGGKAICFSACEDYQLAADTSVLSQDKEMTGAMTTTFIQAIKTAFDRKEKITYQSILDSMHQTLKQAHKSGRLSDSIFRIFHRRILQDPQLSASVEISPSTAFEL